MPSTRGRQRRQCGNEGGPKSRYFASHHQIAKAIDVVAMEIAIELAISFGHSQYDTHAFSLLPYCIIGRAGMTD